MNRLAVLWLRLQASLWFVPGAVLAASVLLAVGLIEVEDRFDLDLAGRWPHVFGAGAAGVRAMLSAVATSMITVAGVVFSITVLVLSQASTQYSPRLLRTFMRDRPTQVVLGVFVGAYAYCLVVLRTVRDAAGGVDGVGFLPALAVFGGVMYALLAVGTLVYFIHHMAHAIQADAILDRIARDTAQALDRLFRDDDGRTAASVREVSLPAVWQPVRADRSGYLTGIDEGALLAWAASRARVVRVLPCIGDFVTEGRVVAEVGGGSCLPDDDSAALRDAVQLASERTIEQDPPYGLLLIVDLAVKALSPGINDPTTAIAAIDRLQALLVRLTRRHAATPYRFRDGELRLVVEGRSYADLLALSFDRIVEHARGDSAVLMRVMTALGALAQTTTDPRRRREMQPRLDVIRDAVQHATQLPTLQAALRRQAHALRALLREG